MVRRVAPGTVASTTTPRCSASRLCTGRKRLGLEPLKIGMLEDRSLGAKIRRGVVECAGESRHEAIHVPDFCNETVG